MRKNTFSSTYPTVHRVIYLSVTFHTRTHSLILNAERSSRFLMGFLPPPSVCCPAFGFRPARAVLVSNRVVWCCFVTRRVPFFFRDARLPFRRRRLGGAGPSAGPGWGGLRRRRWRLGGAATRRDTPCCEIRLFVGVSGKGPGFGQPRVDTGSTARLGWGHRRKAGPKSHRGHRTPQDMARRRRR